jgi:hypothetical protein
MPGNAASQLHRQSSGGQTTTTQTSRESTTPSRSSSDYDTDTRLLAPSNAGADTITIAGVTLSAASVGRDFAALEVALGETGKQARAAAPDGGSAVLLVLAPLIPFDLRRSPVVLDLLNTYAAWAVTQPSIESQRPGLGQAESVTLPYGEYGMMVDLEHFVGTEMGLYIPMAGQSVAVHASAAVSVDGVFLKVAGQLEAEHGHDGYVVSGQVEIQVGVGSVGDHASLKASVGVEGHGADAVQAMHMAGLVIEQHISNSQFDWANPSWEEAGKTGALFLENLVAFEAAGPLGATSAGVLALCGKKIAAALWGENYERDVVKTMTEGDYGVEELGAGVELRGGDGKDVDLVAGLDYKHRTTIERGEQSGRLTETHEELLDAHAKLSVSGGGWELSGRGNFEIPLDGGQPKVGFGITIGRESKSGLIDPAVLSAQVGDLVDRMAAGVAEAAGAFTGQVVDLVDLYFRGSAVLDALAGAGEVEFKGSYDAQSEVLSLSLVLVRKIAAKGGDGQEVKVSMDWETGQEILAQDFPVRRP